MLTMDYTVLPATHTFIEEWNEPSCFYSQATEHHCTGLYSLPIPLKIGGGVPAHCDIAWCLKDCMLVIIVCICYEGPNASVGSGFVNQAADTANGDDCPDTVKVVVVFSLHQPTCVSLAQGLYISCVYIVCV